MGRFLELIVFAVFVWLALESLVARLRIRRPPPHQAPRQAPHQAPTPAPGPRPIADVTLVRCAACGTHVPQSRALAAGGSLYCSDRCRQAAAVRERTG